MKDEGNITLTLGQLAHPGFRSGFRKLRTLGLPCAYELAVVAGTIDLQLRAYDEAHHAAVQRHGVAFEVGEPGAPGHQSGFRVEEKNLPAFTWEMAELEAKPVTLPVTRKLKIGPLTGQLSADDLLPLLPLVEP